MSVRKTILIVHIVVNAAWIGAVLSMLVLVCAHEAALDLAAFALNDVAIWTSLLVLATSICFALFTHWGFVRFRWIALKWLALALLVAAGVFARTPAVNALAACADVAALCALDAPHRTHAIGWLAGEAVLLMLVVIVSVTKPWGRMPSVFEPGPRLRIAFGVVALAIALLASAQSMLLARLRATPIAAVDVASIAPGVYEGSASVGVDAHVRVTIAARPDASAGIERIDVVALPPGHYADLARGVALEMIDGQRVDVDGVSGATTTSRAIQKAVETALTSHR